jgi:hypothetical protein
MTSSSSRATGGDRYPWYDSLWLASYHSAKKIIELKRPGALSNFVDAFRVFQTRSDFEVTALAEVFDDAKMAALREAIKGLRPTDLELHEAQAFGRFVVHDHPFATELQHQIVPLVSEIVGEAVEVSYNFLSLYSAMGRCAVHMDAPQAKWTLDLCVNQSATWPIHFSDVRPWPEPSDESWASASDWEAEIKRTDSFKTYTLEPGQALVFSGSSQWHYRDAIPAGDNRPYCDLLFFHFVPKGTFELVDPKNWARLFDMPELAGAIDYPAPETRSLK